MTAPRLRPMRPDDASAVAALTTQLGYPVDAGTQGPRIAALLAAAEDHGLFVAVDDADAPLGWVHVELTRALTAEPGATLGGLVVDERARSGGIGAALLEAAEGWARDRGVTLMTVRSRVRRERAHRFYERHGYELEKTSFVLRRRIG